MKFQKKMRSATETETWSVDSLGDCTIQFPTKSSSLSKAGANEFVFKSSDPNETVLLEKACARVNTQPFSSTYNLWLDLYFLV